MTREGNGQAHSYQVVLSAQIKAALQQFHLQFAQAGMGNQFIASLRYPGKGYPLVRSDWDHRAYDVR